MSNNNEKYYFEDLFSYIPYIYQRRFFCLSIEIFFNFISKYTFPLLFYIYYDRFKAIMQKIALVGN